MGEESILLLFPVCILGLSVLPPLHPTLLPPFFSQGLWGPCLWDKGVPCSLIDLWNQQYPRSTNWTLETVLGTKRTNTPYGVSTAKRFEGSVMTQK
jgi:hypothetical protein